MLQFDGEYMAGAHPEVMRRIVETNLEETPGYGCDPYTAQARELIRRECQAPGAEIHFLVGGTQVNKTAIAAFLRPYEAVFSAASGHICVHETGSIEQDGHKVIHCPAPGGKLTPEVLRSACAAHSGEHMVVPRLAYISNTTEVGTVYRREELLALRAACDELGLLSTATGPGWGPP